jgi:hypothetical protein
MALKHALAALPDDRATRSAVGEVLLLLAGHKGQTIHHDAVLRATGLDSKSVCGILGALDAGEVVSCSADFSECVYEPDPVMEIEVKLFMRTAQKSATDLRQNAERFRRLGHC